MKRAVPFFSLVFAMTAVAACKLPGKSDANADAAAATPSAAASTDAPSTSASAANNDTPPPPVPVAAHGGNPAAADPGAKPSNESSDQAAKAEISKANYKKEMDKLEKEDLSADTH